MAKHSAGSLVREWRTRRRRSQLDLADLELWALASSEGAAALIVAEDRFGAAAHVLSSYLAHDVCLAVSEYTRDLVVAEAVWNRRGDTGDPPH